MYEAGALTSHFSFHFRAREGELMQGMPERGGEMKGGREEREKERASVEDMHAQMCSAHNSGRTTDQHRCFVTDKTWCVFRFSFKFGHIKSYYG